MRWNMTKIEDALVTVAGMAVAVILILVAIIIVALAVTFARNPESLRSNGYCHAAEHRGGE